MKRMIVMLLVTALLCGSFVGCDAGGGMLATLLELLKEVAAEDGYESDGQEVPIGTLYPSVDIESVIDEYQTQAPQSQEPGESYVWDFAVTGMTERKEDGMLVHNFHENDFKQGDLVTVDTEVDADALFAQGYLALKNAQSLTFGYSIDGSVPTFFPDFTDYVDQNIKQDQYKNGADFVEGFGIGIPLTELASGAYVVELWYQTESVESPFCTFALTVQKGEDTTEVETIPETEPETEEETLPPEDDVLDLSDVLVLDGDISDWKANRDRWHAYEFDMYNLDAWVSEVGYSNGFTMYTAADTSYVYFAFDVLDEAVVYSDDDRYNGDAFQIQIDLNGWIANTEAFERAVFYSFGLQEGGTVDITVQCITDDAASTIDYTMASDDEIDWREGEVRGATKKKEDGSGWIAEFAISWETLYRDAVQKLTEADEDVPAFTPGQDATHLNMLVCYIDREDVNSVIGAWGTSLYSGALASSDGWYPENAGLIAIYEPREGSSYIDSLFTEDVY